MMSHTPTPWKLEEIAPDDPAWEAFEIWSATASAKMIANGSGTANMRVFGHGNAAFIVRAANSHEALVKALKELLDASLTNITLRSSASARSIARDNAREALKLAGSTP